ncbi:MAG: DMT family transporter [Paracoccaceae bacterium]
MLFVVQPGLDGWSPWALLPVVAAMAYASGVILTRWRCQNDPGFSLTIVNAWVNGAAGALGLMLLPLLTVSAPMQQQHPFLLTGWLEIDALLLGLVVATAVTHIAGALSSVKAYQIGEASRLAPFEYSYLVLMAGFGFAIWGTVPEQTTFIGMALIIASGAFIAWREGRPPRPRVQQNAEVPWTPKHLDDTPSMPPANTKPRVRP